MKKLLPLLLVCVLLVVALAATGCKSDELQAQIDTNNANAQTAIQEAAQKAADDLAAAKSALEALVAAGDKANADDLTAALAELNAAIDAAEAAAANADTGIKTYLKAAVTAAKAEAADAVAELKTELTEKIDAAVVALEDAAATDAEALTNAVAELTNAIDAVETAAAAADATLKNELEAAITAAVAALKTELTDKIDAAVAALEAADAANTQALTDAVAVLNAAVEAAKAAAADADAALKTELEGAIATAVAALKTELTEKIDGVAADLEALDGVKVDSEEYAAAIDEIWEEIEGLVELCFETADIVDALDDTYATDAALEAAIAALKAELLEEISKNTAALEDVDGQLGTINGAITALFQSYGSLDQTYATDADVEALNGVIADLEEVLTEKIDGVVADLEALDAAKVNADVYTAKIEELEGLIETLENVDEALDDTYATDADVDAKIEAAVEAAVNALTEKIDGVVADLADLDAAKVDVIDYTAKIGELEGLIETLTGVNADLDETYATDVDVDAKIAEAIAALKDAYIAIEAWNGATEVVNAALKEIKDLFEAYKTPLYADYADDISAAYDVAWILIVRAVDTDAVDTAKGNYKTYLEELPTPGALVYKALKAIAADVDGVKCTADVRKALEDLRDSIDELMARDPAVEAEIKGYIPEGGTEAINLDEKCTEYQDRYDTLKAAGAAIKADMDAVVAAPLSLTLKAGNVDIDAAYDAWIAAGNEATEIDGFVDSKAAYDAKKATIAEYETKGNDLKAEIDAWLAANPVVGLEHETAIDELIEKYNDWDDATNNDSVALIDGLVDSKANIDVADARVETLKDAKTAAIGINTAIDGIVLVNTGDATKGVKTQLESITNQINGWVDTYGLGTDAELEYGENYNMVNHEKLAALYEKFDELVGEFMAAFEDFMNAYDAIGDVNLLSRDEIAAAREAYDAWRDAAALGTFDYELTDGIEPVDYAVKMLQKESEYNLLVEDALAAYEASFDANLTVNTVNLYSEAAVKLIEDWYAEFAVGDVEYVFEDGYYLSEDITVTEEDYAKVVALRAAYEELVAAKKVETANVNSLIANLGTITTASRDAIDEAITAYNAWLAGDNAPAGYNAAQFAIDLGEDIADEIDVVDKATLDAADTACEALEDMALALKVLGESIPKYTVSTDFADDTARDDYWSALVNFTNEESAFMSANHGSIVYDWDGDGDRDDDDGAWHEANRAVFSAAVTAIYKYDAVERIKDDAALWTADGNFVAAVEAVIEKAIAAIDADTVTDQPAIVAIEDVYSAKLDTLNGLQTEYKAALAGTTDADAQTAIGAVCDEAIAYVIDDANDVDAANAEVAIAEAKFDSLVEVAGAYATAAAGLDPADEEYEINLGALKTAYTDYIDEVKAAETATEVANATSAAEALFDAIVDAANA